MKSISFKEISVKAIHLGKKTETRRPLSPQPTIKNVLEAHDNVGVMVPYYQWRNPMAVSKVAKHYAVDKNTVEVPFEVMIGLSHYQLEDLLYIREVWRIGAWREDGRIAVDYKATPEINRTPWVTIPDDDTGEKFKRYHKSIADELVKEKYPQTKDGLWVWSPGKAPLKWHSPRFMPQWASRFTIKITGIGLENIQSISNASALAEGAYGEPCACTHRSTYGCTDCMNSGWIEPPVLDFIENFWKPIYSETRFRWENNPLVWQYQFKMMSRSDGWVKP